MAKKKHHKKKSQYKARKSTTSVSAQVQGRDSLPNSPEAVRSTQVAGDTKNKPQQKPLAPAQDSEGQVIARRARREVLHTLVLGGIIMLGLIALWCLFAFTSIGSEVYKAIRI